LRTRSRSVGQAEEADDQLAALRTLLLRPEQLELDSLRTRLEDPELHARDVSRILAEAIVLRAQEDDGLTRALQPILVETMRIAIRDDPQFIADAIYPVIGPAIRKAVANAFRDLVRGLNATLERAFSPRALVWRWEAWRTGKPFAEVILLHTLVYRVEQVFLIHRQDGLVLQHLSAPDVETEDPEVVGGMLSAIEDYMRDSFGAGANETLSSLEIGELTAWIEQGPRAVLAAVVRGVAPEEMRAALQDTLESVHANLAGELAAFTGDTTPFARARPYLEECLLAAYGDR
jgi:OOP family OmpA-OmpF porin